MLRSVPANWLVLDEFCCLKRAAYKAKYLSPMREVLRPWPRVHWERPLIPTHFQARSVFSQLPRHRLPWRRGARGPLALTATQGDARPPRLGPGRGLSGDGLGGGGRRKARWAPPLSSLSASLPAPSWSKGLSERPIEVAVSGDQDSGLLA